MLAVASRGHYNAAYDVGMFSDYSILLFKFFPNYKLLQQDWKMAIIIIIFRFKY